MKLASSNRTLSLNTPIVMGILNTTPDSFSDGGALYRGRQLDVSVATETALKMADDGATIIDIGGESTRPGATPVGLQQELDRTIPIIESLRSQSDIWISIDTSQPEVMRTAAATGADVINDVRSFSTENALQVASETGLAVCVMHMQGQPQNMQDSPRYDDVVGEVEGYLQERIDSMISAGIGKEKIVIDPGFGFGKTSSHNIELLQNLKRFRELGHPVLAGLSRKRLAGDITSRPVHQRLAGSIALAMLALQNGASILRVHDVAETVDMVKVYSATCVS